MSLLPPPSLAGRRVDHVAEADRPELEALIARDPLSNAVIDARMALFRSLSPRVFGGQLLVVRDDASDRITGAAFYGGNLLPIGGDADDWIALARHLGAYSRFCTSIVGRADAVAVLWGELSHSWGPARAVRTCQPLLVIDRNTAAALPADPRVRPFRADEIDAYLPAAAAMFTEELGVSPFVGRSGITYRDRITAMLGAGRAFGIRDREGRVAFKADLGALTHSTVQVQGVWTRPDLRGRGLGTAALGDVLRRATQLAPTASLYVNDFNLPAQRMYDRLGMRRVAELSTVLF